MVHVLAIKTKTMIYRGKICSITKSMIMLARYKVKVGKCHRTRL